MSLFMSQKTVGITFFADRCARNCFFTREVEDFEFMDWLFDTSSWWQTYASAICNPFRFIKTCLTINIPHLCVHFTLFALQSQQKFDDRTLYKIGAFWFATIWGGGKKFNELIPNNAEFKFMEKNSKKKLIKKKRSFYLWDDRYIYMYI